MNNLEAPPWCRHVEVSGNGGTPWYPEIIHRSMNFHGINHPLIGDAPFMEPPASNKGLLLSAQAHEGCWHDDGSGGILCHCGNHQVHCIHRHLGPAAPRFSIKTWQKGSGDDGDGEKSKTGGTSKRISLLTGWWFQPSEKYSSRLAIYFSQSMQIYIYICIKESCSSHQPYLFRHVMSSRLCQKCCPQIDRGEHGPPPWSRFRVGSDSPLEPRTDPEWDLHGDRKPDFKSPTTIS